MFDAQTQSVIDQFLTATNHLDCDAQCFDAAYEQMSEQIPDFALFEQICMFLGLA